jgi:hypothetical protein
MPIITFDLNQDLYDKLDELAQKKGRTPEDSLCEILVDPISRNHFLEFTAPKDYFEGRLRVRDEEGEAARSLIVRQIAANHNSAAASRSRHLWPRTRRARLRPKTVRDLLPSEDNPICGVSVREELKERGLILRTAPLGLRKNPQKRKITQPRKPPALSVQRQWSGRGTIPELHQIQRERCGE